ncbi:hypothetical protein DB31_8260 [Hyalangium minutum]|uniref:Uncharacterized protein n=1 Tax=Hyalangium minutum TaxID=394096 RepID=A0A085WJB4_9BACT|nr:hypothetical protein DB31_8260 [Hyalangium minutum]
MYRGAQRSGAVRRRFVEAVRRLGYEQDIAFLELPVRGP